MDEYIVEAGLLAGSYAGLNKYFLSPIPIDVFEPPYKKVTTEIADESPIPDLVFKKDAPKGILKKRGGDAREEANFFFYSIIIICCLLVLYYSTNVSTNVSTNASLPCSYIIAIR